MDKSSNTHDHSEELKKFWTATTVKTSGFSKRQKRKKAFKHLKAEARAKILNDRIETGHSEAIDIGSARTTCSPKSRTAH